MEELILNDGESEGVFIPRVFDSRSREEICLEARVSRPHAIRVTRACAERRHRMKHQ